MHSHGAKGKSRYDAESLTELWRKLSQRLVLLSMTAKRMWPAGQYTRLEGLCKFNLNYLILFLAICSKNRYFCS